MHRAAVAPHSHVNVRASACARVFEGIKRKLYCVAVAVSCELRGGLGVEVLVEVKGCMGRGILREGRPTMVTTAKHKPFASGLDLQHIDKLYKPLTQAPTAAAMHAHTPGWRPHA